PVDFCVIVNVTLSGPPCVPLKACWNVYQPELTISIGWWPGSAGSAPQRSPLLPAEITKPNALVPALKTKSRRKLPLGSLIADDQSNRRSKWLCAQGTSR